MKKTLGFLGVSFLLLILYSLSDDSIHEETPPATPFKTAEVLQGPMALKISATGVVEPNFQVEVKSKASGEVLRFPFEEGDSAKKGDLLLELDKSDELRNVAKAEADKFSTLAKLKKARAALLLQQTKYATDLKNARSEVEEAEASLKDSKDRLKRQADLFERKFVSQEALQGIETEVKVNTEKLVQARARLQAAKDAVHDIAMKESEIELAKAEVERAKIALEEARDRLEETEIFTPISGVIIEKLVEEGQIIASGISNVSGGTALASIADISRLFIIADVDETDIGKVKVKQPVLITTDAYPDKTFEGIVTRIAPKGVVESSITVFKVKIEIIGPGRKILRPMMSANVDIVARQEKNAVYVPREAVRKKEGGLFAVVLDHGQPREVAIKTGIQNPIHAQVLSGLKPGDQVIVGDWKQLAANPEKAVKRGSTLKKILWMIRSK